MSDLSSRGDVDPPVAGKSNILALVPAYNEEERVARVVAGTRVHLPVLVVDDGSTDDTANRAREAGAEVLEQRPNQGKGRALRAGFRRAMDEGRDAVITLDADGQHDPTEIPGFLDLWERERPDLIIGARDFSQMPWLRRLANSLGRRAFSWAVGHDVRDNQSGYRLIGRKLMEALLASDEEGFEFEVEMIVICVRGGFTLRWVPIRTIYAGEGSHINPIRHVARFVDLVWRTRKSARGHA